MRSLWAGVLVFGIIVIVAMCSYASRIDQHSLAFDPAAHIAEYGTDCQNCHPQ